MVKNTGAIADGPYKEEEEVPTPSRKGNKSEVDEEELGNEDECLPIGRCKNGLSQIEEQDNE
jgi:hypothetical protein